MLELLCGGLLGKSALSKALGPKVVSGQLHEVMRQLMGQGLIEFTIPEKPSSRLQRYRLTGEK